jgi:hypothetical protein
MGYPCGVLEHHLAVMVAGCIGLQLLQAASVQMVLYPEIRNPVPPKTLLHSLAVNVYGSRLVVEVSRDRCIVVEVMVMIVSVVETYLVPQSSQQLQPQFRVGGIQFRVNDSEVSSVRGTSKNSRKVE